MWKQLMGAAILVGAMAAPAAAYPQVVGYYGQNGYYGQGYYGQPYSGNGYYAPAQWTAHQARPLTYVWQRRGGIMLTQPVDLFVAPTMGAPMIACMQPGATFTLLGRGHGWAKVRSKYGTVGYIPEGQYY